MKTALCLLMLVVGVAGVRGEKKPPPATRSQLQTTRKTREPAFVQRPLLKVTSTVHKPHARFGGFLTDFATSKEPLKMVDPFRPGNSAAGSENLIYNLRTGRPKGFLLFSLRF
jgi:hypothetical protein